MQPVTASLMGRWRTETPPTAFHVFLTFNAAGFSRDDGFPVPQLATLPFWGAAQNRISPEPSPSTTQPAASPKTY